MDCRACSATVLPVALALCFSGSVAAWEIELRGEVATRAAIVRLGDIAEITGVDPEQVEALRQITLVPGPSKSLSRSITASQIRLILLRRGVELDACLIRGAARTIVTYDADTRLASRSQSQVRRASLQASDNSASERLVEQRVAEAVQTKLKQLADDPTPWSVDVSVSHQALSDLPAQWQEVTVEGLKMPREGSHQLVACFAVEGGAVRIPFTAKATQMVQLVVPVRPLDRGVMVGPRDVELRHVTYQTAEKTLARRLEDVVGRQVQFPMNAGDPMNTKALKRPILVKRRDVIEVSARRAGVAVKTQARAIDEGAEGDTITVERLDDRKTRFVARVTGVQQAEVFVGNASAECVAER